MGLMGPSFGQSLAEWVGEMNSDTAFGGIGATTAQMDYQRTNLGNNFLRNGDFESWSAGTASAPDGWTLTGAAATVARDATNVQYGTYSAKVTRAGTDANIGYAVPDITQMKGRTCSLSGWVFSATANIGRFTFSPSVGGASSTPRHSGDSKWHYFTLTKDIPSNETAVSILCEVLTTDGSVSFDGLMLVIGSAPHDFVPHTQDLYAKITNYQNTAATNNTDRGVWRKECGTVRIVTDGTVNTGTKTVTFQTAFRTILGVNITIGNGTYGSAKGKFAVDGAPGTSSFVARIDSGDGSNLANTNNDAYWEALGEV